MAEKLNYVSYKDVGFCEHHCVFDSWLKMLPVSCEISIFDMGCGNANVLNYLTRVDRYVGIEISERCLEVANQQINNLGQFVSFADWSQAHLMPDPSMRLLQEPRLIENVQLFLQDIEEKISEEVLSAMNRCNICYLDSTLTMVERPLEVLKTLIDQSFEYIFLNRTNLDNPCTIKTTNKWDGMETESTLWKFGEDYILSSLSENPKIYNVDIGNNWLALKLSQ